MRQKIYANFYNLDDAKLAMGSIKKENLNQADLKVVFLANESGKDDPQKSKYEFGEELFHNPMANHNIDWPGVKVINISRLGNIQFASSNQFDWREESVLSTDDLEVIEPEVKAHKIVTIIEAEVEIIPKLKFMLHSNGGEII